MSVLIKSLVFLVVLAVVLGVGSVAVAQCGGVMFVPQQQVFFQPAGFGGLSLRTGNVALDVGPTTGFIQQPAFFAPRQRVTFFRGPFGGTVLRIR